VKSDCLKLSFVASECQARFFIFLFMGCAIDFDACDWWYYLHSHYNLDDYENLTEQQVRLMAAPFIGKRPDKVQEEENAV